MPPFLQYLLVSLPSESLVGAHGWPCAWHCPSGLTLCSSPSVDTTRVALRDVDESVPGSDYINANYIKVLGKGRRHVGLCLWWGCAVMGPALREQQFRSHSVSPSADQALAFSAVSSGISSF